MMVDAIGAIWIVLGLAIALMVLARWFRPMRLRSDRRGAVTTRTGILGAAAAIAAAVTIAAPMITRWEGHSNDPYRDIVGVWTVCSGETRVAMRRYSDAECRAMTRKAIESDFAPHVLACTPRLAARPQQFAAAISLAYNIGAAAYCSSTVDRRFDAGDWRGGCDAMTMWNRAGGRVVPGLVNRRRDERRLCMTGL